ncbi:MAG TPA: tRNA 2-thiouridine(34) synthase MnmA [Burkholderiales bacterium]|nr:tRNA 2-thiouridine(34) synthase MnmA [Burkholderiales bacterium]
MSKVVVGLSGGVDSSVAAYLLKEQGFDVSAIFMQNWEDSDSDYCTIKQDSIDAISVADILGIDINIINFSKEYKDRVFSYFLQEYKNGRTPNPDILCNSEIKFKAFLEHALKSGAVAIATGHYVDKITTSQGTFLTKAFDSNKDQSYFLYRLNQHQIKHAIFPLGKITKSEVRKIASKLNLPTAEKKDSTGICFIGERPFREFLKQYMPTKYGKMVTPDGKIVGEHIGLMYYTIGQRKGLGIGGLGDAWFVADKNLETNELIVVQGHAHPLLLKKELIANQLSFILGKKPAEGKYTAKTRYRMQEAKCTLTYIDENQLKLVFDESQWAITPGQSVVIYDDTICLGGGIIL